MGNVNYRINIRSIEDFINLADMGFLLKDDISYFWRFLGDELKVDEESIKITADGQFYDGSNFRYPKLNHWVSFAECSRYFLEFEVDRGIKFVWDWGNSIYFKVITNDTLYRIERLAKVGIVYP